MFYDICWELSGFIITEKERLSNYGQVLKVDEYRALSKDNCPQWAFGKHEKHIHWCKKHVAFITLHASTALQWRIKYLYTYAICDLYMVPQIDDCELYV